ncbi:nucleotidyltransferase [Bacillus phage vB_BanS_Nate]|uniref:Nucleotidyltransferase n=1 Tax=Bacillus phage vB_BanS_Nate TaxID=2894788 RepID=A0AAE9CE89_9CAUD|nr:nucleotidyltransferase [Bacillus phage vB_BanS_Nate]UGO50994.1 nucleotidyltransferase [Bacillus phage vB_BanS_Nate]
MKILERNVVMKALVGSNNYSLNTEQREIEGRIILASDKDYKAFITPTFEELYRKTMFAKSEIGVEEDIEIHDVRKLPDLFWKANLNYLEPLYSKELWLDDSIEMKEIYNLRQEIFNMNLPTMIKSLYGTYRQKMKLLPKGTESTQVLVDLFGYDTKQAQHAYRHLDFAIKYAELDFKNPEQAFRYSGGDLDFMTEMKFGSFRQEVFENMIQFIEESRFKHIEAKYEVMKPNEELKEHVDNLIMSLVRKNLVA